MVCGPCLVFFEHLPPQGTPDVRATCPILHSVITSKGGQGVTNYGWSHSIRRGRGGLGNAGFTLVEVLIVLAIVAILSAIALPSYSAHQQRALATEGALALLGYASLQQRLRLSSGQYQTADVLQKFRALPKRLEEKYSLSVSVSRGGAYYLLSLLPNSANAEPITLDSVGRRAPASVWP